jgi:hypothetical protein
VRLVRVQKVYKSSPNLHQDCSCRNLRERQEQSQYAMAASAGLKTASVNLFCASSRSTYLFAIPHQAKGRGFRKCPCPKYLYVYKDGTASRASAKTGSWAQAEKKAQEVRDSWVPEWDVREDTVTRKPQPYRCPRCDLEFSLRRRRCCRRCGTLLLIPSDSLSDSECTALRSFWMWDPARECWAYIRDWEEHKRQAMQKLEGHLKSHKLGNVFV